MQRSIVNDEVEAYLEGLAPVRHPVVEEMERLAHERGFPIVGPLVGSVLEQLALIAGARRVFEMGSGFGYSTFWFARALSADGEVVHTDLDQENQRLARDFMGRGGVGDRVRYSLGEACELLEAQPPGSDYDVIFCDIDKEDYPKVPDLALPRLRPGGLLIVDNALWYGRVADAEPDSAATDGVQRMNRDLCTRDDVLTTILPLRDGVLVARKR